MGSSIEVLSATTIGVRWRPVEVVGQIRRFGWREVDDRWDGGSSGSNSLGGANVLEP